MNGIIEDRTWDSPSGGTGSNELLETLSGTGARISRMAHGVNGRALAYVDNSGTWRSLITDIQGSVIGSLDTTTIATSTVYDPFGEIVNQTGDATPIDWLGRSRSTATGDVDLVNRWYNPSQGRFTSPDQYRYVDPQMPYSLNLYQYGYSNPMMYMDREGLAAYMVNARKKKFERNEYYNEWTGFVYDVDRKDLVVKDGYIVSTAKLVEKSPKNTPLSSLLGDEIFVFEHGFNVTESDAIVNWTVKLYNRLVLSGFKGDLVVYTWYGDQWIPAAFEKNVANANAYGKPYAELLQQIRVARPNAKVNIAAHSLGNRVMLSGLKYAQENSNINLGIHNMIHLEAAVDSRVYAQKKRFRSAGEFHRVHSMVDQIYNLTSSKDTVLSRLYQANQAVFKSSYYPPIPYHDRALGLGDPLCTPPANFQTIPTESMGINSHSAMMENVYRATNYTMWKKEYEPVERFWQELLKFIRR